MYTVYPKQIAVSRVVRNEIFKLTLFIQVNNIITLFFKITNIDFLVLLAYSYVIITLLCSVFIWGSLLPLTHSLFLEHVYSTLR